MKKADGAKVKSDKTKNVMRDLHIRKLCLNICVGESGDRLTRAAKVRIEKSALENGIQLALVTLLFVVCTF